MQLRIARHTNRIAQLTTFYCDIIGLDILGDFKDHDGYDGIFLGKKDLSWHLEFTQSETPAEHTPDEDDLLVFYPATQTEYNDMLKRIETNCSKTYRAKNPYWNQNGVLIKDPDSYGIIISPLKISS